MTKLGFEMSQKAEILSLSAQNDEQTANNEVLHFAGNDEINVNLSFANASKKAQNIALQK